MPEGFVENPVGIRELIFQPAGPVGRYMVHLGRAVQAAARIKVGVDTGFLRDHIVVRFDIDTVTGPVIEVGSDAVRPDLTYCYAEYHHEPQPEFDIDTTDRGHPMVFKVAGQTVFTYHVHHPAWPGNPYLREPMEQIVGGGLLR